MCLGKMEAGGSEKEVHHPRLQNVQSGLHESLPQYNYIDTEMTSELLANEAHHSHETFENVVDICIRTMTHSGC